MTRRDRAKQLLRGLKSGEDARGARRIRRELGKLGYSLARKEKPLAGIALTRRDRPRSVVTTLRLEAGLHRRLQLLAADEGRSANEIIEKLLRRHLDAQGIPFRLKRRR